MLQRRDPDEAISAFEPGRLPAEEQSACQRVARNGME
jgi:hypothetical protein